MVRNRRGRKWFGFLLTAQALALVPKFLVLAYYRRLRLLPWVVRWVPFELLERVFLLEALLAYRMPPVKPPLPLRARWTTWRSMLPGRASVRPDGTRREERDHGVQRVA
jgi:hypothetical protein